MLSPPSGSLLRVTVSLRLQPLTVRVSRPVPPLETKRLFGALPSLQRGAAAATQATRTAAGARRRFKTGSLDRLAIMGISIVVLGTTSIIVGVDQFGQLL